MIRQQELKLKELFEADETAWLDAMADLIVKRLEDTEIVKFGPDAIYQPIIGDDEGTTPVRTGIQTSQPGYAAPLHQHPYMEILHILDGVAEAWTEGKEDQPIRLEKGDTIALPPELPHAFRVVGDQTLRLLGTHVSPRRSKNRSRARQNASCTRSSASERSWV